SRAGVAAVLPRRIRNGRRRVASPRGESPWERPDSECIVRHRPGEKGSTDVARPLGLRRKDAVDDRTPLGARVTHGKTAVTAVVGMEEPNSGGRAGVMMLGGMLSV